MNFYYSKYLRPLETAIIDLKKIKHKKISNAKISGITVYDCVMIFTCTTFLLYFYIFKKHWHPIPYTLNQEFLHWYTSWNILFIIHYEKYFVRLISIAWQDYKDFSQESFPIYSRPTCTSPYHLHTGLPRWSSFNIHLQSIEFLKLFDNA